MNGLSTRLAIRQASHRSAVRELDQRAQQRRAYRILAWVAGIGLLVILAALGGAA